MQIDKNEVLTVDVPYGKVEPLLGDYCGFSRFVKEFDDVREIDGMCYLKQMFQGEIDKIQEKWEVKELEEQRENLNRKIERMARKE
jgi:hypothetical protein